MGNTPVIKNQNFKNQNRRNALSKCSKNYNREKNKIFSIKMLVYTDLGCV